jgi:UDP-N-acetylmuramate dehydrogenase
MLEDINLKPYNTFGIAAKAKWFTELQTEEDALNFFKENNLAKTPHLILGGGSNILLTKDYDGHIIKNAIKGIEVTAEDSTEVNLKVGAGENWHNFVMHTVNNSFFGLENLSLIPGCVGASPMQNIGAYGVEVKDTITRVYCIEIANGNKRIFDKEECEFGYRTSIFKTKLKDQYFIYAVEFKLSKKPQFHLEYGAIKTELEKMGAKDASITIKDVSDAVIAIRQSKLPDPAEIGNAGSFFKNPVVSEQEFKQLKDQFEDIAAYIQKDGSYKIAAGWLIEKAGWKGFTEGDYGVHKKQALVLVNYNNAKGSEILALSERIIKSVKEMFSVSLEREVNII